MDLTERRRNEFGCEWNNYVQKKEKERKDHAEKERKFSFPEKCKKLNLAVLQKE